MDKIACIIIRSNEKGVYPKLEDPTTWEEYPWLIMVNKRGGEYVQYISKEEILNQKHAQAEGYMPAVGVKAEYGRIILMGEFLEGNYGKVFTSPMGTMPNINAYLDDFHKKLDDGGLGNK